jgi:precorrin-3B synthase
MSASRGACPTLFTPMQTGDGLLARIVPADRITPARFIAFCAAAERHGNGTIEVSARGSLQVRGLSAQSAPLFATDTEPLGIAAQGVPIITDPLAGDPAALVDAADIAAALRAAIDAAGLTLAPKVSVIVDGGGTLHLDALVADVRLRAINTNGGPCFHVALAGDSATATPLGSIPTSGAVDVVLDLLRAIAARGDARATDLLRSEGLAALQNRSCLRRDVSRPQPRPAAEIIGLRPLRNDRFALGVALAFGHARADVLADLVRAAADRGVSVVRPAPDRAVLLIGVRQTDAVTLAREAERLDFIVRADDPRRRIVACPGRPACGSGLIASRALAAQIAGLAQSPSRGIAVHVSGCRKGCAHPGAAALTIVGTERGCGIVHHGSARAVPNAYVNPADIASEFARVAPSEAAHA